ncbi:MAG: zinc-binding dehydrogenase [Shimia sp.]
MPTLPQTMRAWHLTAHGGPEALTWRDDLPVPRPGPGEVLIRTRASSVNNTDINTRTGWYSKAVTGATEGSAGEAADATWTGAPMALPRIQGADCLGEVVAGDTGLLGRTVLVRALQIDPEGRVITFGSECDGGFAEFAVARADQVVPVPAALAGDPTLAALPCAYGTALALLRRAGVAAGDRVLVTGASGGVGAAAVQLCAALGAVVTARTGAAKAAAVRALGARATLDRDEAPAPRSVDAVLDLVGGPGWTGCLDALRDGGRYATAGAIAGPIVELDLRDLYLRDLTLAGSTRQGPEILPDLVAMVAEGGLRPAIAARFALADLPAAQAAFAAKTHVGKILIDVV